MSTTALQRRPLGQILISEGILSEDQLRIALLEQMKCNQPIGKLLVSLGFVTEATLRAGSVGEPGQAEHRPAQCGGRPAGFETGAARTGQAPPPAAA